MKRFSISLVGFCLIFVLVFAPACGKKAEEPTKAPAQLEEVKKETLPTPTDNVAHVSDIHFNPFYDPGLFKNLKMMEVTQWEEIFATSAIKDFGTYGKDETNYPLLKASLEAMAQQAKKPDFVMFTGDFIAHDFHTKYRNANDGSMIGLDDFIKNTVTFVVLMIDKYFPGIPVYFCLGNNDSYSGDYQIVPTGRFLKETAPLIAEKWFENPDNRRTFNQTYKRGGYFSAVPPKSENSRVISINSIYFSVKYTTTFTEYDPGDEQLRWLQAQLEMAKEKNEKVWLLLHIPPGANGYSSVKNKNYVSFWKQEYLTIFNALMKGYAPIINASYAGHTHMDDFRLHVETEPVKQADVFIHICPAVSPQFGNNPAFLIWNYTPSNFQVINYNAYYVDIAAEPLEWKFEYDFKTAYGQSPLTPTNYYTVYNAIEADESIRAKYMKYYDASHGVELTQENWHGYWCVIANWLADDFNPCLSK